MVGGAYSKGWCAMRTLQATSPQGDGERWIPIARDLLWELYRLRISIKTFYRPP